ncbi:helix-hairpin-helix domain-containing protein [Erysipelothrix inopinata]|uniref:Helix-hairpin-helix domain-containing protein n=1 Tax=Erysipelothrix inopinata TaxID=225084 RepID=A0A7G9RYG7_9FIRM|nr:helix-hairpin-helix domain-containing protein [Erysipelothrix inopinata]QNN60642.1 helix-hairpin-helix domain-containing protein [Erysipelothrix inopinata]
MQRVFIFGILICLVILALLSLYDIHPIEDDENQITVSVVIDGNSVDVETEPFATIQEVIKDIDLPPNIDYEALNLNQVLFHRDVITLPVITVKQKVSINTASVEDLVDVPGIGPATAEAIVLYRSEIGQFQTLEDLMNVKGIGSKKFEKIKDLICL